MTLKTAKKEFSVKGEKRERTKNAKNAFQVNKLVSLGKIASILIQCVNEFAEGEGDEGKQIRRERMTEREREASGNFSHFHLIFNFSFTRHDKQ